MGKLVFHTGSGSRPNSGRQANKKIKTTNKNWTGHWTTSSLKKRKRSTCLQEGGLGLRLAPSADNTIMEIRGPCRIILQFSAMAHCKTAKKNNKKNNKDTKIKTNRNKSKKKTVV